MPQTENLNYLDENAGSLDQSFPFIKSSDLESGAWGITVPAAQQSMAKHGFICLDLDAGPQKILSTTLDCMRDFFAQDEDSKSPFRDHGDDSGWMPSGSEPAYQPGTVSHVESYDFTQSFIDQGAESRWPSLPGFHQSIVTCWNEYVRLAEYVLELVARATGLPKDFLVNSCSTHEHNSFRLLNYPGEAPPASSSEVGIAAHTDFECITLLYQNKPGLELRNVEGEWIDMPAAPGMMTVLLGDMLERWTNGTLQATGHRVRRTTEQRYSIVMFMAVNDGIRVAPLPQFVSADHPQRYAPTEQATHTNAELARARENRDVGK